VQPLGSVAEGLTLVEIVMPSVRKTTRYRDVRDPISQVLKRVDVIERKRKQCCTCKNISNASLNREKGGGHSDVIKLGALL